MHINITKPTFITKMLQLATCVKKPETLHVYDTFFDGGPISEVLLQIDPEPTQPVPTTSSLQGLGITAARIKIFHCIIKNIKAIYEVYKILCKLTPETNNNCTLRRSWARRLYLCQIVLL